MSWSYKIAFLYIGFVVVILTGVIGSTFQDFDLVKEDYYEAEIAYQDRIDEIQHFIALEAKPVIALQEGLIEIRFPDALQAASGTVHLYRPSDAELDKIIPLELKDGIQQIPTALLKKGRWRVQMEFEALGTGYYQEQSVELP